MTQAKLAIKKSELKSLSKEELYQIATKLKKVEQAKQRNRLKDYLETAHEGQIEFHKNKARIRLVTSGNRWGKSFCGAVELLWRILGVHPFIQCQTPIKALLLAQDYTTHVRDVLWPRIESLCPPDSIVRTETNQTGAVVKVLFKNGSILDIKSHDQDIKVFEGSDYDVLWSDEPPPEKIFKAIWRGLTDRGGIAFITGTVVSQPWITDLIEKAKADKTGERYWHKEGSTYENAKNIGDGDVELGRKRIREFEEELDKDERAARIYGKVLHLQGLIFKNWSRSDHIIKPFKWPSEWPIWVSIDPAQAKPWAVAWLGFTPSGNVILIRSDLVEGVIEDVAEYCYMVRDEIEMELPNMKPKITKVLIDNAANVASMSIRKMTIAEELGEFLKPTFPRVESGPKDVTNKINIFKQWLNPMKTPWGERPKFLVFDGDNDRFVYEVEHYIWKPYRTTMITGSQDKPLKKDDDIIDAVLQLALMVGKESSGFATPQVASYIR